MLTTKTIIYSLLCFFIGIITLPMFIKRVKENEINQRSVGGLVVSVLAIIVGVVLIFKLLINILL